LPQTGHKWERRISRARELAGRYPFATEILTFYSKLTDFQQCLYTRWESKLGTKSTGAHNGHFPLELSSRELETHTPQFKPFLSFLAHEGTPVLAAFARGLEKGDSSDWASLLTRFWQRNGVDSRLRGNDDDWNLSRFVALSFLQPYAEYLAGRSDTPLPVARRPICPFCESKPLGGVLRPEGDGAKRSLVCSFCYSEWDYLRIACPACGESRDDKMCVYVASQFEHVRVEACETCRSYIKTVDLTKDGLAVPEVDELAAIPLTLWADEKGYTKLERSLFGS
jgi:FdhE protein